MGIPCDIDIVENLLQILGKGNIAVWFYMSFTV